MKIFFDTEFTGLQKDTTLLSIGLISTVIYTRVSTTNQKDDLRNQIEFLKQYANAKGFIVDEIFEDIGSRLNYNRKSGINSLKIVCLV